MDPEILKRLDEQDKKLLAIYRSVEKTRRYLLWTFIVGVITFILPLIGIISIVPTFLNTIGGQLQF